MTKSPYDVVFFDFGGVVAEEGFKEGLKALAREAGRDQVDVWQTGLKTVWDGGYVLGRADEAAFWTLFKERTGLSGDENHWRELIFSLFSVRPWMRDLADRMKSLGAATAILSDQTDWLPRLDESQRFYRHFDTVFNSYDHGLSKLEPEFFQLAMRTMRVGPDKSLFLDDNAGNVERARGLGMSAILYEDQNGFLEQLARLWPQAVGGL